VVRPAEAQAIARTADGNAAPASWRRVRSGKSGLRKRVFLSTPMRDIEVWPGESALWYSLGAFTLQDKRFHDATTFSIVSASEIVSVDRQGPRIGLQNHERWHRVVSRGRAMFA
jgi:hypothetical protein